MIKLSDISSKMVRDILNPTTCELIRKSGAESVEDVIMVMGKYKQFDWERVQKNILGVEKQMEAANKKGKEPEKYFTKGYQGEDLSYQDTLNNGLVLLLDNPTHYRTRYKYLKQVPISEIKADLAHTNSTGENYVESSNSYYRFVGSERVPRVVSLVEMYEQQIERQSKLTKSRDINLFELDQMEKRWMVEDMYSEIVLYLVCSTKESLVWSNLSDEQKKIYLSSAIKKTQEALKTRQKIVEYVANYTTVPELEQVEKHNLKVLNRFIVK